MAREGADLRSGDGTTNGAAPTPELRGDSREVRARRRILLVTAGWFLIALWLPLIQMGVHLFPEVPTAEKRQAVAAPPLTGRNLRLFGRVYEPYFRDQFGLRDHLLRWENLLLLRVFHVSPVSKLIFGRDGWIFYQSERVPDGVTIRDFQGLVPYSPADLRRIRSNITERTRACRELGAECWIVIAPNKETIYSEYLPASIRRIRRETRLDQVVAELRGDSTVRVIDLRPALREARRVCPNLLYSRGGTHWNQFGAYYAYREIVAQIGRGRPGTAPYDLEAFRIEVDERFADDHWLGLKDDVAFRFTLADSGRSSAGARPLGKIVVWHDSFWNSLEPFFRLHEPGLVARPSNLGRDENLALIAQEKPRFVIYEVVERYADGFWNRAASRDGSGSP